MSWSSLIYDAMLLVHQCNKSIGIAKSEDSEAETLAGLVLRWTCANIVTIQIRQRTITTQNGSNEI